jgi:hypothetical protein
MLIFLSFAWVLVLEIERKDKKNNSYGLLKKLVFLHPQIFFVHVRSV